MSIQIAWIGRQNRQEWNFAWQELSQTPSSTCTPFPTVKAAREAGGLDLVVVALSRPGEHAWTEIHSLSTSGPNTQIVCILGAWCCGLRRVTPELTQVANYYVHELRPGRVLEQLVMGRDETIKQWSNSFAADLTLAIYARTASYSAALSESLSSWFPHQVELRFTDASNVHGVDIVLWELSPYRDEWLTEMKALAMRHPGARVIALANYPRHFECAELQALGDVSVLAQPFPFAELLRLVREAGNVAPILPLKQTA